MSSFVSLRRLGVLAVALFVALVSNVGMASATTPSLISRAPGYLDVFQRNPQNGHLMHSFLATGNGGWSPWYDLSRQTGSNLVLAADSDIATTSRTGANIDVFFRSDSNQLWSIEWNPSGGWTGMFPIPTQGNLITRGPTATSRGDGTRMDVFFGYLAPPANGKLGNMTWYSSGWTGIAPIGGDVFAGTGPAVASNANGSYDLVYTGTDQQVYSKSLRSGAWSADQLRGTTSDGSPGGSVRNRGTDPSGREDFLVREPTGGLRLTTWRNGSFSGWVPLDGTIKTATGPAAAWWKDPDGSDRLDIVAYQPNGGLNLRTYREQSGWTAWVPLVFNPTSWTHGGANLIVDTDAEADAVIDALRGQSDADAATTTAGLSPADRTTVSDRAKVRFLSSAQYGGANLKVDTAAEADSVIAAIRGLNDATALGLWNGLDSVDRTFVRNRGIATSPTSTQYGGQNLKLDADSEYDAVLAAVALAGTTQGARQIVAGLTPSDRVRLAQATGVETLASLTDAELAEVNGGPTATASGVVLHWTSVGWKFSNKTSRKIFDYAIVGSVASITGTVCAVFEAAKDVVTGDGLVAACATIAGAMASDAAQSASRAALKDNKCLELGITFRGKPYFKVRNC